MNVIKEVSKKVGMNIRYTINLHKAWDNFSLNDILDMIKKQGIADQFSFRKLTTPSSSRNKEINEWIIDNGCEESYNKKITNFGKNAKIIRRLPYGAILYDIDGIGFTHFDFCIQEESNEYDIRSLIYQLDGHLYTSWDSTPASKIF